MVACLLFYRTYERPPKPSDRQLSDAARSLFCANKVNCYKTPAQAFTRATDFCNMQGTFERKSSIYMVLYKVLTCKIDNLM